MVGKEEKENEEQMAQMDNNYRDNRLKPNHVKNYIK